MASQNNDVVFDKICNAGYLSMAQRHAQENGVEFKFHSQTEVDITYTLIMDGKEQNLDYCQRCKRALVDTSYCDGCDQDDEDDFNRGDWL